MYRHPHNCETSCIVLDINRVYLNLRETVTISFYIQSPKSQTFSTHHTFPRHFNSERGKKIHLVTEAISLTIGNTLLHGSLEQLAKPTESYDF